MTEVVDSIVADLTVRYQQYVRGFDEATAAHDRFTKSVPKIGAMGGFTQQEAQQYADRHTNVGKAAEEAGKARATSAKTASAVEKAEAKAAADAVSKAARDAATAQKQAAKEAAAAVKQAARERAAADRQAEREKAQSEARYYSQGPKIFEAKAREISAANRSAELKAERASAEALKIAEREKQAALKATQREQEKAAAEAVRAAEIERAASAATTAAIEREIAARARLALVVERAVNRAAITPSTSGRIGATVPREGSGQRGIPSSVINAAETADVAVEKEVNHLIADRFDLQQRVRVATGDQKRELGDQLEYLSRINRYKSAGLAEDEAILRAEKEMVVVARLRDDAERRKATSGVKQFAEGAGLGRTGGSTAAIAGITAAIGVAVGVEVIQSAVEYGKAIENLSKQLGVTVEDLQAYQQIARETGVETTTLSSAFGQFASNLGRAQQGQEEYAKTFRALGVDIKDFSSAGDALPTIIDRISSLKDPLQRAAIETRLFGEEGRKLDPLLAGGADRVRDLAASLQETGRALSQKEIQELDETARKLGEIKNQLSVDFARIVAGNASSIIGLANAFGTLANSVLNFATAKDRAADISVLSSNPLKRDIPTLFLGYARGKTTAQIQEEAFSRQAQSPDGRALLRKSIADGRARLAGAGSLFKNLGNEETYFTDAQRKQAEARYTAQERSIALAEQAGSKPAVTAPVQRGAVNQKLLGTLGAPKPPKGPKGKSAEQIEREEEQRTKQFNEQVASANAEYLRAQQQMTGNADKRADIEIQMLDEAYKARLADIESNRKRNVLAGADAKREATRAVEIGAAEKKARDANASAVEQDRQLDNARALTSASATLLDVQAGLLSSQLAVARTARERKAIELQLLENAKDQERNRLNGVIRSSRPGDPAATNAKTQLDSLDKRYQAQGRDVAYRNRSPMEQYRDELPRTADQINEALDNVKVRGLQSLDDKITDSISKVFKLGGAFGDVANQIISDLIRIGVQRAIIGPLADMLFGGGEGTIGGPASFRKDDGIIPKVSGVGGIFKTIAGLFGRASGGHVVAGVPYNVGENGPERVVFGSSGKVYPNGTLPPVSSGTGGLTVIAPQQFDLRGVMMTPDVLRQMDARNQAYTNQVVGAASRQTLRAAPGYLTSSQRLGGPKTI